MEETQLRTALQELNGLLRELHRGLIAATRREYEAAHGPIGGPYALLGLVANDAAFAWLRPLSALIVQLDELEEKPSIDVTQAAALRAAVAQLVLPSDPESAGALFYARLREARDAEPSLVVTHTHVRMALGALPQS
jgi:hypothetical protein